jgi:calcineurin-like phosphoesterase family protein
MFREPKTDILVVGDVHGSWSQIEKAIRHAKELGLDTIFQVGDYGIWNNDKPFLNQQQALLEEWDMQLLFIDGNHENFPRLYEKKILDDGTRYVRDNITHVPRGFRWTWHGLTFLALGGAASIDKRHRRTGHSWWPEELITVEDIIKSQEGGPVDVMFTHDSPSTAPNSITDDFRGQMEAMEYFGHAEVEYCTDHRNRLAEVTNVTTPRLLIHGHYHRSMYGTYTHQDENSTMGYVRGLDQGLAPLSNFTMVFSFDSVKTSIEELDNMSK